jgi:hypothetical protein
MHMFTKIACTLAAGLVLTASAHASPSPYTIPKAYDAAVDFSGAANPNGIWRYGYSTGDSNHYAFSFFDQANGWGWSSTSYQSQGAPAIWKNGSPDMQHGAAPGQVSLHPGPNAYSPTIVRFVAPAAGVYQVNVGFFAGDSGVMNGGVFLNDDTLAPLAYFASTDAAPTYSGQLTLALGSVVDVAVGNNGSFNGGNTPVTFTVQALSVPEATTAWMLGAGLLALGSLKAARRSFRA